MQNIHFCFIISSIVLVEIKSFVLQLLTCVFLFLFFFGAWKMQEPEIEYVEGDYELEEEDDIEDFGGLAMDHIHTDDDNGKFSYLLF